ncbi:MAG: type IV pilus twitching motility protein PilT [Candidatus Hydrogenedentes bacterium]|nr:type IV pilus twitching motility protein PilT [Candidatus Hydrogenedentota bacterium]
MLKQLLQSATERGASDVHIKTNSTPYFRVDGQLIPRKRVLTEKEIEALLKELLSERQRADFDKHHEVDLAHSDPELGRFRVNVFQQRGTVSMVFRHIKSIIPSFEELHLPMAAERFSDLVRGLVLITGTTGSGKSTTLAAIIDHINERRKCHIVTIEDPIEYTHMDKKAVVNQREIKIDTESFSTAMKSVMRQDPDVILVGEMRDLETFQAAISASETGHLVFSTLHTANAMQTVDRIVDLFPSDQQDQVRSQLSLNLRGIMCQRLLPRASGSGRVPTCEVLINTPSVQKLIKENRLVKIPLAIQAGREEGMLSFNDSLYSLLKGKLITSETAMEISDNPAELNLMLQGIRLGQMQGGILGE